MSDKPSDDTKRYNLNLPRSLWLELEQIAQEEHVPTVTIIKAFLKLGIYLRKHPDGKAIVIL